MQVLKFALYRLEINLQIWENFSSFSSSSVILRHMMTRIRIPCLAVVCQPFHDVMEYHASLVSTVICQCSGTFTQSSVSSSVPFSLYDPHLVLSLRAWFIHVLKLNNTTVAKEAHGQVLFLILSQWLA